MNVNHMGIFDMPIKIDKSPIKIDKLPLKLTINESILI